MLKLLEQVLHFDEIPVRRTDALITTEEKSSLINFLGGVTPSENQIFMKLKTVVTDKKLEFCKFHKQLLLRQLQQILFDLGGPGAHGGAKSLFR